MVSTSPRVIPRSVGFPDSAAMAIDDGSVWVASPSEGTVVRIDARTNKPPGEPISVGSGPTSVAARDGIVWVANSDDSTITRIDAGTGEVAEQPTAVGGQPVALAAGEGGVWVADLGGAVTWIDAESNAPNEPISVGGSPQSLAYGEGALWVADAFNRRVSRIER